MLEIRIKNKVLECSAGQVELVQIERELKFQVNDPSTDVTGSAGYVQHFVF